MQLTINQIIKLIEMYTESTITDRCSTKQATTYA